jgi:signal transduction histidine kinase
VAEALTRVHNFLELRLLHLNVAVHSDQAEEWFAEAQKVEMLGHIAAGVAHEFNNSLSVIMGYNDLLLSDLSAELPMRRYSEEIQSASERASALTHQLLAMGLNATAQAVELDFDSLIKEMAGMIRRRIPSPPSLEKRCWWWKTILPCGNWPAAS